MSLWDSIDAAFYWHAKMNRAKQIKRMLKVILDKKGTEFFIGETPVGLRYTDEYINIAYYSTLNTTTVSIFGTWMDLVFQVKTKKKWFWSVEDIVCFREGCWIDYVTNLYNDLTGDALRSTPINKAFAAIYDEKIFREGCYA